MTPTITSIIDMICTSLLVSGGTKPCIANNTTPITRTIIPSINILLFYNKSIKGYKNFIDLITYYIYGSVNLGFNGK